METDAKAKTESPEGKRDEIMEIDFGLDELEIGWGGNYGKPSTNPDADSEGIRPDH